MLPQVPEGVVWAILLLPVASLSVIALGTRPNPRWSGYAAIAGVTLAFLLSLWVLDSVIDKDGHPLPYRTHEWLTIASPFGQDLIVNLRLRVAPRAGLLAGLHGGRWRLLALLRLPFALHRLDARARAGR